MGQELNLSEVIHQPRGSRYPLNKPEAKKRTKKLPKGKKTQRPFLFIFT